MAVEGKLQLQRYAWNSSIVVAMAVALWLLCFSSSRTRAKQNMAMSPEANTQTAEPSSPKDEYALLS
ncbi:hypothetical protein SLEP1_g1277 [Rubroshorea leprosula]|uniref:Uncharacterized protein n=1 Tax=Rubroshorea leprosula TaxID=152421 RepID=A0AAV5HHY7_9ROSI|nr:hypothetical protein SLEP1_g1277 [Rubroshorea leprosula]